MSSSRNDGATILKEMDIEHPSGQDDHRGRQGPRSNTATTARRRRWWLAGELLKRSEDLIEQNVHPTVICEGFRLGGRARAIGNAWTRPRDMRTGHDAKILFSKRWPRPPLTGKSAGAVQAVPGGHLRPCRERRRREWKTASDLVDLADIKVEKRQGGFHPRFSTLVDGIILLDKERVHAGMPRSRVRRR